MASERTRGDRRGVRGSRGRAGASEEPRRARGGRRIIGSPRTATWRADGIGGERAACLRVFPARRRKPLIAARSPRVHGKERRTSSPRIPRHHHRPPSARATREGEMSVKSLTLRREVTKAIACLEEYTATANADGGASGASALSHPPPSTARRYNTLTVVRSPPLPPPPPPSPPPSLPPRRRRLPRCDPRRARPRVPHELHRGFLRRRLRVARHLARAQARLARVGPPRRRLRRRRVRDPRPRLPRGHLPVRPRHRRRGGGDVREPLPQARPRRRRRARPVGRAADAAAYASAETTTPARLAPRGRTPPPTPRPPRGASSARISTGTARAPSRARAWN